MGDPENQSACEQIVHPEEPANPETPLFEWMGSCIGIVFQNDDSGCESFAPPRASNIVIDPAKHLHLIMTQEKNFIFREGRGRYVAEENNCGQLPQTEVGATVEQNSFYLKAQDSPETSSARVFLSIEKENEEYFLFISVEQGEWELRRNDFGQFIAGKKQVEKLKLVPSDKLGIYEGSNVIFGAGSPSAPEYFMDETSKQVQEALSAEETPAGEDAVADMEDISGRSCGDCDAFGGDATMAEVYRTENPGGCTCTEGVIASHKAGNKTFYISDPVLVVTLAGFFTFKAINKVFKK